jgi:hypothetical protein
MTDGERNGASSAVLDLEDQERTKLWRLLSHPEAGTPSGAHESPERFLALPSLSHPRYLLPLRTRRSAAAALLSDGRTGGHARNALRLGLAAGLSIGAAQLLLQGKSLSCETSGSLPEWLGERLGGQDVVVAVMLGPPRPNRKPVLRVMAPSGATLAYAKVGWDGPTSRLVRREAIFLERSFNRRPVNFQVPELLAVDVWNGFDVALISALGSSGWARHRIKGWTPSVALVEELSSLAFRERQPALESLWWQKLASRVMAARWAGAPPALDTVVHRLGRRLDGAVLELGTWHGDFAPWNVNRDAGGVQIWDWERAGGPVPVGFDLIHWHFQIARLVRRCSIEDSSRAAAAGAGDQLQELGIPAEALSPLLGCYLVELFLRFHDHRNGMGSRTANATCDEILEVLERDGERR